ncbi:MAG TPA: heme o synthase [Bacteroidota bacterium]
MNQPPSTAAAEASGVTAVRSVILDYLELMKPELTSLSVLTALGGFYLASDAFDVLEFFLVGLGTLLLGGGAGSLNQYAERSFDALMKRTERRPLPAGRLNPSHVLVFGYTIAIAGLLILFAFVNPMTGWLGVATFCLYVYVYTPLKRKTWLSTIVGAVPGALPPVMGWTAGGGSLDGSAAVLFGILFLWQMPHFFSLAWMYRKDYSRAGYRMLTVTDPRGSRTSGQTLLYTLILLPVSVGMTFTGITGSMYAVGAILLGLAFLTYAVHFRMNALSPSPEGSGVNHSARLLFFASLLYLPALFFLMTVDKM